MNSSKKTKEAVEFLELRILFRRIIGGVLVADVQK